MMTSNRGRGRGSFISDDAMNPNHNVRNYPDNNYSYYQEGVRNDSGFGGWSVQVGGAQRNESSAEDGWRIAGGQRRGGRGDGGSTFGGESYASSGGWASMGRGRGIMDGTRDGARDGAPAVGRGRGYNSSRKRGSSSYSSSTVPSMMVRRPPPGFTLNDRAEGGVEAMTRGLGNFRFHERDDDWN